MIQGSALYYPRRLNIFGKDSKAFTDSLGSKMLSSDVPAETVSTGEYMFLFPWSSFFVTSLTEGTVQDRDDWRAC